MQIHKRITTTKCHDKRTKLSTEYIHPILHHYVVLNGHRLADFESSSIDSPQSSLQATVATRTLKDKQLTQVRFRPRFYTINERQESISHGDNTAQTHAAIKFVYIT